MSVFSPLSRSNYRWNLRMSGINLPPSMTNQAWWNNPVTAEEAANQAARASAQAPAHQDQGHAPSAAQQPVSHLPPNRPGQHMSLSTPGYLAAGHSARLGLHGSTSHDVDSSDDELIPNFESRGRSQNRAYPSVRCTTPDEQSLLTRQLTLNRKKTLKRYKIFRMLYQSTYQATKMMRRLHSSLQK
jgi:hypothetical protein